MTAKNIVIVDIDGTLANVNHREHFLRKEPQDWDSFNAAWAGDTPFKDITNLVGILNQHYQIVFCTARREALRGPTMAWLIANLPFNPPYQLLMRPSDMECPDADAKPLILKQAFIHPEDVAFILEDRNSVVKRWRELGYTCLQVAEGDF